MRQVSARVAGLGLAALLLLVERAQAGPLNPNAFTSLGTLNLTSGSYTINTDTRTLMNSGGQTLFTGVLSSAATGSIAVFDFSGITIGSGVTITATGSHPLALLSQSSATLNGTINANGSDGGGNGGNGGPGGGGGGGSDGSPGAPGTIIGGGGGALEIGTIMSLVVGGTMNANGGDGNDSGGGLGTGAGGSGGGRVLVEFGLGEFANQGTVKVSGGSSNQGMSSGGGAGVFTQQPFAPPRLRRRSRAAWCCWPSEV